MSEGTLGVVIAAVILVLGGVGVWMVGRASRPDEDDAPTRPDPQPEPTPDPAPPVEEPTPTPPPVEEPAPEPVDPPTEPPAPESGPGPEDPGADPAPVPPEPAPDPDPEPEEPVITFPPDPMRQPFIEPGLTAGHLYVDPAEGNDRNDGRTPEKAVRTVHEAHAKAAAGNVVIIRGGRFRPRERLVITKPLTLMGYGTERPVFDLSDIGSGSAARMFTPKAPGVHLKGFEFANGRGMDGGCIYVDVPGIRVDDMHAHDIDSSIVYVYGGSARISDVVIWKIGDGHTQGTNVPDGIVVTGRGHAVEIIRPVVFNGPDDGIDLYESHDVDIRDPLIVGSGYYWNGNPGGGSSGDGNGVKLGGNRAGTGRNRTVGGLIIGSRSTGVSHNQAPAGQIVVERTTTVRNGYHGVDVGSARGNAVRRSVAYGDARGHYAAGAAVSEDNSWDRGLTPKFRDPEGGDYALTNAEGIGASEDTLELARYWLNADIPFYAGGRT